MRGRKRRRPQRQGTKLPKSVPRISKKPQRGKKKESFAALPRLPLNSDRPQSEFQNFDDPRSKFQNFTDLRSEFQNYDDPRPSLENYNDPRPLLDNYDDPQPLLDNCDDPRPGFEDYDDPWPGFEDYDDPRVEFQNYDDPRPGFEDYDDPRAELQNYDDPRPEFENYDDPRAEFQNYDDRRPEFEEYDDPKVEFQNSDDPRNKFQEFVDPRCEFQKHEHDDSRSEFQNFDDPQCEFDDPRPYASSIYQEPSFHDSHEFDDPQCVDDPRPYSVSSSRVLEECEPAAFDECEQSVPEEYAPPAREEYESEPRRILPLLFPKFSKSSQSRPLPSSKVPEESEPEPRRILPLLFPKFAKSSQSRAVASSEVPVASEPEPRRILPLLFSKFAKPSQSRALLTSKVPEESEPEPRRILPLLFPKFAKSSESHPPPSAEIHEDRLPPKLILPTPCAKFSESSRCHALPFSHVPEKYGPQPRLPPSLRSIERTNRVSHDEDSEERNLVRTKHSTRVSSKSSKTERSEALATLKMCSVCPSRKDLRRSTDRIRTSLPSTPPSVNQSSLARKKDRKHRSTDRRKTPSSTTTPSMNQSSSTCKQEYIQDRKSIKQRKSERKAKNSFPITDWKGKCSKEFTKIARKQSDIVKKQHDSDRHCVTSQHEEASECDDTSPKSKRKSRNYRLPHNKSQDCDVTVSPNNCKVPTKFPSNELSKSHNLPVTANVNVLDKKLSPQKSYVTATKNVNVLDAKWSSQKCPHCTFKHDLTIVTLKLKNMLRRLQLTLKYTYNPTQRWGLMTFIAELKYQLAEPESSDIITGKCDRTKPYTCEEELQRKFVKLQLLLLIHNAKEERIWLWTEMRKVKRRLRMLYKHSSKLKQCSYEDTNIKDFSFTMRDERTKVSTENRDNVEEPMSEFQWKSSNWNKKNPKECFDWEELAANLEESTLISHEELQEYLEGTLRWKNKNSQKSFYQIEHAEISPQYNAKFKNEDSYQELRSNLPRMFQDDVNSKLLWKNTNLMRRPESKYYSEVPSNNKDKFEEHESNSSGQFYNDENHIPGWKTINFKESCDKSERSSRNEDDFEKLEANSLRRPPNSANGPSIWENTNSRRYTQAAEYYAETSPRNEDDFEELEPDFLKKPPNSASGPSIWENINSRRYTQEAEYYAETSPRNEDDFEEQEANSVRRPPNCASGSPRWEDTTSGRFPQEVDYHTETSSRNDDHSQEPKSSFSRKFRNDTYRLPTWKNTRVRSSEIIIEDEYDFEELESESLRRPPGYMNPLNTNIGSFSQESEYYAEAFPRNENNCQESRINSVRKSYNDSYCISRWRNTRVRSAEIIVEKEYEFEEVQSSSSDCERCSQELAYNPQTLRAEDNFEEPKSYTLKEINECTNRIPRWKKMNSEKHFQKISSEKMFLRSEGDLEESESDSFKQYPKKGRMNNALRYERANFGEHFPRMEQSQQSEMMNVPFHEEKWNSGQIARRYTPQIKQVLKPAEWRN